MKNTGIFYGILAFVFWGLTPVFFKQLNQVPAFELLAHRVLWSAVILFIWFLVIKRNKIKALWQLVQPSWHWLLLSSLLISVNWFLYIYSVISDQILAASLGYFINPLLNVALGVIVLKEGLTTTQKLATLLACIGVINETLSLGHLPWLAISLPLTFAVYGLIRKKVQVDAAQGLFLETLLVLPIAIGYMAWLLSQQQLYFGFQQSSTDLLLVASGLVTILPLLWFILAVQQINLTTVGLLQYIAPSLMFLVAVFYYHEPFSISKLFSFGCIWLGLIAISISNFSKRSTATKVDVLK